LGASVSWVDYGVIAVYLFFSVYIGLHAAKRNSSSEEYFVGGRRQSWFPVSISIVSAELSAISYMGIAGWIYERDISYFMFTFLLPVVIILIIRLFIPIYRRLNLISVYEFLEKRYNVYVRAFTALLFILLRVGHMATAIFAPALVLQEIVGIPLIPSIAITGMGVTLYTLKGGMTAVIWTDFMQFFVLIGGAVVILMFALSALDWDIGQMWHLAGAHTRMFNFAFDLREEVTVWGLVCYMSIYFLTTYATDQVIAQRYFTTRSESETRRAMLSASFVTIPVVALLMFIGIALTAYYAIHPELSRTLSRADRIMPHFAMKVLPSGAKGLLVAGVFAATMSTISAGVNSLSAVLMRDFLVRFGLSEDEDQQLKHARWVTLLFGVLITVTAFYVGRLGSVLAIIGKLQSFFMGPICALFTLGVISKRANSVGVILGGLTGLIATLIVVNLTTVSWLWWIVVGFSVSMLVGYVCSRGWSLMQRIPVQPMDEIQSIEGS
jgi:SSS family solute:Na+ symporter